MQSNYTQDVEFNSGFGALQTPVHVFTAAALRGYMPPKIDEKFRFLDLACGNGLTLALVADAYPHAEFVGIDINKDHIIRANARAQAAGLKNVSYYEGDVATIDAGDYEPFDYCAVSGVYSWLDAERRIATRKFLSDALAPGGILYLDYSTQPGMAQSAALYRMLQEIARNMQGSSAERLSRAAGIAHQMREQGALFFKANPIASDRLNTIMRNPAEDEAHEVLNLQEGGFWSADVIDDMSKAEFEFAGHSALHHNLKTLSSRPNSLDCATSFETRSQESLFDVDWNIPHRRDIFVRRGGAERFQDILSTLEGQRLFAVKDMLSENQRRQIGQKFRGYDFCSDRAGVFADAALKASTFGDLFSTLRSADISNSDIADLTRHFLSIRLVSIAAAPSGDTTSTGPFAMGSSLNQNILVEDIGAHHVRPFASPVAGTRVLLPLKDRLYLWAVVGLDLGEAWERLGALQNQFRGENNQPIDRLGFVEIIQNNLSGFKTHAVPELLRMKILVAR